MLGLQLAIKALKEYVIFINQATTCRTNTIIFIVINEADEKAFLFFLLACVAPLLR